MAHSCERARRLVHANRGGWANGIVSKIRVTCGLFLAKRASDLFQDKIKVCTVKFLFVFFKLPLSDCMTLLILGSIALFGFLSMRWENLFNWNNIVTEELEMLFIIRFFYTKVQLKYKIFGFLGSYRVSHDLLVDSHQFLVGSHIFLVPSHDFLAVSQNFSVQLY